MNDVMAAIHRATADLFHLERAHTEAVAAECLRLHAGCPGSEGVELILVHPAMHLDTQWTPTSVVVSRPARGVACAWPKETT